MSTWSELRRLRQPVAVAILFVTGLVVYASLLWDHRGGDDAFITYRLARHLAEGRGLVWNPGEPPVYGSTTILFTAILALVRVAGLDIAAAAMFFGAVGFALSAVLLFALAARVLPFGLAFLTGLAFALTGLAPVRAAGLETMPYLAAMLAAFLLFEQRRPCWAAAAAATAWLYRPDGALCGAAVWLHQAVRSRLGPRPAGRFPWTELILLAGPNLLWMAAAWRIFGWPVPQGFIAKHYALPVVLPTHFNLALLGTFFLPGQGPAQEVLWLPILLYAIGGVGFVVSLARRELVPFVLWGAAYGLLYQLLGLQLFWWYFVPLLPWLLFLIAQGVRFLAEQAALRFPTAGAAENRRRSAAGAAAVVMLLFVGGLAVAAYDDFLYRPFGTHFRVNTHQLAGHWFRDHTPPEAAVGAIEVGAVGYYSERRVVDLVGLVSPEIARHLAAGQTDWAFEHYRLDYLFLPTEGEYGTHFAWVNDAWRKGRYVEVNRWSFTAEMDYVALRRVSPAEQDKGQKQVAEPASPK